MITVIIPTYNAMPWLKETIDSVLNDSSSPTEIILIDDGSTDGTDLFINEYYGNVKYFKIKNSGVCFARNFGFQKASGDYIVFLDADDLIIKGKMARQAELLKNGLNDIVYSNWIKLEQDTNGQYNKEQKVVNQLSTNPDIDFLKGFWCPTGSYMFKRKAIERLGGFDDRFPIIQDAVFVNKAALINLKFGYDTELSCKYRVHKSDSLSTKSRISFFQDRWLHYEVLLGFYKKNNLLDEIRLCLLKSGFNSLLAAFSEISNEVLFKYSKVYVDLFGNTGAEDVELIKRLAVKIFGVYWYHRIASFKRII